MFQYVENAKQNLEKAQLLTILSFILKKNWLGEYMILTSDNADLKYSEKLENPTALLSFNFQEIHLPFVSYIT